jgi:capsular exopolysaccharide synthesis family protein
MEMEKLNGHAIGSDGSIQEPTFADYLQIVLRGKWVIMSCLVLVLAATAIYTFTMDPTYEATTSVLVDTEGQKSGSLLFDITGYGGMKSIKNELEILKSNALAEAVAKNLLEREYVDETRTARIFIITMSQEDTSANEFASIPLIVKRLSGTVGFDPVRESDVIRVTARSKNPQEAALIANTYARAYYDRNMYASRARSRAVREFLDEQLGSKKESLATAEDALQSYMEKKGVVLLDEEAKKLIEQLSQLEALRDAADVSIQSVTKTLASYKQQLAELEPNVARAIGEANDPYIRLLQDQIAKLEVQRDVTVAQNPQAVGQDLYRQKLSEIDEQISALRLKLQDRTSTYLETVIPGMKNPGEANDPAGFLSQVKQKVIELQIELQELQSKKGALTEQIAQYESQFDKIPQKSIEFARLQRQQLSSEKLYLLVEQKYNEAAITEKSDFGYVDIIDPAVVPLEPVSPRKRINMLLGVILGLGLGVGLVFARERFDIRVRTPEDLRRKGYTALTAIALMNRELKALGRRPRALLDGRRIDLHLLTVINPLSPISESYRRLRTNLQYSYADKKLGAILVTSASPGEGKSTTASNLAVTFAQDDKTTLLIDADLRKPNLHGEFGFDREPGLTDVLYDGVHISTAIKNTGVENLDVLTAGKIPPNPAEAVGSKKFKELLDTLRRRYDLLIFDSPPLLAVTDSAILATLVDGVVIVVETSETKMEMFEHSAQLVREVGGKFLGTVLNKFELGKAYGTSMGYYKHKYYSYGYGAKYGSNGENGGRGKKKQEEEQGKS